MTRKSKENNNEPLTVVGIGASAGALQVLRTFFSEIPSDSGLTYVVVVHLSPDYKSMLDELLQMNASMPVQQVTSTIAMEPNHIYVIPPNAHLNSIDTHLRLSELEDKPINRAPIDHFFRTLASTHDGHSVGIILTGTGSDGALGVREIKGRHGVVMVQDPNEAEYDEMPQSAIATGVVDLVLPLREIPRQLLLITGTRPKLQISDQEADQTANEDDQRLMQKVFAQITNRTGRDFSRYKMSTIMRRIERRMQLYRIEYLSEYLELLQKNVKEVRALSDDFLITVTNFFRDPEVYEAIEKEVIPQIFENKSADEEIRVWSVGCATGEEAYSLAILLMEEASRQEAPPRFQVFASDLHEPSLQKAREGYYPGDIETDISEQRLKRFFSKEDGGYRIGKAIRESVIFTSHNVLGDPPFSKVDLIVCRNLLIYLKRDVQRDIFNLFHYALCPNGYLVLGTSEHLENSELFPVVQKEKSIYAKRNIAGPEPRLPVFPLTNSRMSKEHSYRLTTEPTSFGQLHQKLVEQYVPPSILVSMESRVLHLSEHVGRYLVHPGGVPTQNLFKLLREELKMEIRTALHEAKSGKGQVMTRPVAMKLDGIQKYVVASIKITGRTSNEKFALIMIEEHDEMEALGDKDAESKAKKDRTYSNLEEELGYSQERLEAIIGEYENAREEMKVSNEELQSANEELRSTLEELETSKEELQSMNEELNTVNQENRRKVEELSRLSSDLQNLLEATDIATLFLDREFRIMRFTPRLGELFSIRPGDCGRLITDLTHKLRYESLYDDARQVLTNLTSVEREVKDDEGNWFLSRILPYRNTEDRVEGVVLTFVNITSRKVMEDSLRSSEERLQQVINIKGVAILIFREDGVLIDANDTFLEVTGYSKDDVKSKQLTWRKMTPAEYMEVSIEQFEGLRKTGHIGPYEKEYLFKDGSRCWVMFVGASMGDGTIVEYMMDISDRKKAEQELRESQKDLLETRQLLTLAREASRLGWGAWDFETGESQWDERARHILGLTNDDTTTKEWFAKMHPEDREHIRATIERACEHQESFDVEYRILYGEDKQRFIHHTGAFSEDHKEGSIKATGHVRDITEHKQLEQSKDDFIKIAAHELKTPVTVFKGFVNMVQEMLEGKNQHKEAGYLSRANRSVDKILQLIHDMLEASKIDAGRVELQMTKVDFDPVVQDVVEELQYIYTRHKLNLSGETNRKVACDRERIRQVINNLISNAIKYSDNADRVDIKLSTKNEQVMMTVKDYGVGMAQEEADKIFNRFYRVKKAGFHPSGLGLGLYISAEIVKQHGGEIEVKSKEGEGSTFTVLLPVV